VLVSTPGSHRGGFGIARRVGGTYRNPKGDHQDPIWWLDSFGCVRQRVKAYLGNVSNCKYTERNDDRTATNADSCGTVEFGAFIAKIRKSDGNGSKGDPSSSEDNSTSQFSSAYSHHRFDQRRTSTYPRVDQLEIFRGLQAPVRVPQANDPTASTPL